MSVAETSRRSSKSSPTGATRAKHSNCLCALAYESNWPLAPVAYAQTAINSIAYVDTCVRVDSASASSHHKESTQSFNETLHGTNLQAGNNLTLSAGQDLTLSASRINVSQGSATLLAGGNVKIETDTERHQSDTQHTGSHAGLLTSTTIADHNSSERTDNIASAINATAVTVIAGQDLLVSGSSLSSQTATTLIAGNKLIISAAQDSRSESHDRQQTETGLMVSLERIDLQVEQSRARQSNQTTQAISRISSQGDTTLIAGNQLGVYASTLSAGTTLSLQGTDLTLLGGLNASSASEQDSSKHSGGFTVYHDPGKGINAHEAGTQDQANTTLVATTLSGQNINIKASGNQGDNGSITLAGVQATTPGSLSLDAGNNGTLNLNNASTETSQASSHTSGDLVYQKMQGQGNQQESGHANVLNTGQLNINAAKVNVPLAQSLQQLTQQPGMDYLNQLLHDPQLQGKVNWSAVELAHQHWDYEQQGLTQAGAVIVAIVVAYFTLGAASGVGVTAAEGAGFATTTTAAGTTVMATTAGTMFAGATTAAITTLATQASISLINNQGDLGKTLNDLGSSDNVKGLVTAMLTGGALAGLNFSPTGQPTVNGGAQSFSSQLGHNLQAGIARSLISTAINGGSLEDSLKTSITAAFIDTGAAQGAFAIGELKDAGTLDAFTHKLAHALAGCAAGAARAGAGEGCAAGAIGAAVGEMAAEAYGKRADTVEFAAMISGIAAAVAGGDASQINLASQAGANAAANNYLSHAQALDKKDKLAKAKTEEERKNINADYDKLEAKQSAEAAACLLKDQCGSIFDKSSLRATLDELNAACAPPRLCTSEEKTSIAQLGGFYVQREAIPPDTTIEEVLFGNKIIGAAFGVVRSIGTRLLGETTTAFAKPLGVVSDFEGNTIKAFEAAPQYAFKTDTNFINTGANLEASATRFVKDEAGKDFIGVFDSKIGTQGLDLAYAKMVNGQPQLVIGEAKAGDSALTALGENYEKTLTRNLATVKKSIDAMPDGTTRAALLRQLDDRTYQVELYTTTGNAAKTASRIDSVLTDRLQQPISRVVTFGKQ